MLKNQEGMAVFEIVPILVVFVLLLNFAIGFFGAIHSGILNSIAARNYALETFRNRANLNYLRDSTDSAHDFSYAKTGYRYHGTVSENSGGKDWVATKRNLKFSDSRSPAAANDASTHNTEVIKVTTSARASDVIAEDQFDSIWVRTVYGICLNRLCGE